MFVYTYIYIVFFQPYEQMRFWVISSMNIKSWNAAHCNTLQHTATQCTILTRTVDAGWMHSGTSKSTRCSTLHRTATHRNTLQHTADAGWNHLETSKSTPLQHTATHCNKHRITLQMLGEFICEIQNECTATHCNTLQHTATHCRCWADSFGNIKPSAHCNTLQHTATHCNTLQMLGGFI